MLLLGQSQNIKNLESSLGKLKNVSYVQKKIKLSELYRKEGFHHKAVKSAQDAFTTSRKLGNEVFMAQSLLMEAEALKVRKARRDAQKALNNYKRAWTILQNTKAEDLKLLTLQSIVELSNKQGNLTEAAVYQQQIAQLEGKTVTDIAEENAELNIERDSLIQELDSIDNQNAVLDIELARKQEKIAMMTQQQVEAELLIAQQKNLVDSLKYNQIIDSIRLQQQELSLQQNDLEIKEKQAQLELQQSQRNLLIALAAIVAIVAYSFYSRYKNSKHYNKLLETKNEMITQEKKRSEELLLNILPYKVAEELKRNGNAQAREYKTASVLFADFKDFSKISKKLSPEELVQALDQCFKGFDQIITKYNLEKIKTIGDSYMVAGGLPNPDEEHVSRLVQAAFEMQTFLKTIEQDRREKGLPFFEARIGIHTGPLIAGIVGTKKFAYDVWGDTVNVASRMESACEVGKVNISANTFRKIKDEFPTEYRGKVRAKNLGLIDMYYVMPNNGKSG